MNGILRLLKNELIKIYHQTSWRVMTVIVLVIVTGYPILVDLLNDINRSFAGFDYEKLAESAPEGSIEKENYLSSAAADAYFNEKGMDVDNWQYIRYYHEYRDTLCTERALRLIAEEGRDINEVLDVFFINGVHKKYSGISDTGKFEYDIQVFDDNSGELIFTDDETVEFTIGYAEQLLKEIVKLRTYIEEQIDTSFSEYIRNTYINRFDLDQITADYETAKAVYEKDKSTLKAYQAAELKAEACKRIITALNKLNEYSDTLSHEQQCTVISTLADISYYLENTEMLAADSEGAFALNGNNCYFFGVTYNNYDEYVEAVKVKQDLYYRSVETIAYSLENNKFIDFYTKNSVRSHFREALKINMAIVMFFGIFLASVIVSGEYSSGAIRLLVIRPRAKWKILLSKLLCMMIYVLGITAVTSVLSLFVHIILYGQSDLNVPYLIMHNGSVSEVPPIIYYIYDQAVSILPSLMIMCAAFLLSVISKKSVFALAISLLANVFAGSVSRLLYNTARTAARWLKLTPIPYFNLNDCFPNVIFQLKRYNDPLLYGINLDQGITVMCIYSAVFIAAAFVIFCRQQIKN